MIQLENNEKELILICKGHREEKYPYQGYWHLTLKPWFTEIYGWNPDEDNNYQDYLQGLFHKLLDLYLKIKDNWSNENGQLKEVFNASFRKGISNDAELPIERSIHSLCALIQFNEVVQDGIKRYDLNVTIKD